MMNKLIKYLMITLVNSHFGDQYLHTSLVGKKPSKYKSQHEIEPLQIYYAKLYIDLNMHKVAST